MADQFSPAPTIKEGIYRIHLIPALMDYTKNYIYIIEDIITGSSAIVDPGEAQPVIKYLKNNPYLKPDKIINTHHHFDHVNGNLPLKNYLGEGVDIISSRSDESRIQGVTKVLEIGDILKIGQLEFEVRHTPGHTDNHIAFYSKASGLLFCGDTMFSSGCGAIFEGGSVKGLWDSFQYFKTLPDDTIVYPAHEYTIHNLQFAEAVCRTGLENKAAVFNKEIGAYRSFISQRISSIVRIHQKMGQPTLPTTIKIEKLVNPFMIARSLEDFSALREWKSAIGKS